MLAAGGVKLEHAIKTFNIDVKDKIVMDVGRLNRWIQLLPFTGAKRIMQ